MTPGEKCIWWASVIPTATVFLASQYGEWVNRSWGALYIGLGINPLANAVIAVMLTVVMLCLRSSRNPISLRIGLSTTLAVPTVGCLANLVSLSLMDIHGG